jgi:hypothetical protein
MARLGWVWRGRTLRGQTRPGAAGQPNEDGGVPQMERPFSRQLDIGLRQHDAAERAQQNRDALVRAHFGA